MLAVQHLPADVIMSCLWSECDIIFGTGSMGVWSQAQQVPYGYSSAVQTSHSSQNAAHVQQVSLGQLALTFCLWACHLHLAVMQLPVNHLKHIFTA